MYSMSLSRIIFTLFFTPFVIGGIVLIIFLTVTLIRRTRRIDHHINDHRNYTPPEPSSAPTPEPEPSPEPAPIETKTFPEILKSHRTARHMSQEYLAEQLGVTRQAVSKWESGTSEPSTANLLALAKLYGISLDELVGLK